MSRKLVRPALLPPTPASAEWCRLFTPMVQDLEVCRRLAKIPYKAEGLRAFNQKNHERARRKLFNFIEEGCIDG